MPPDFSSLAHMDSLYIQCKCLKQAGILPGCFLLWCPVGWSETRHLLQQNCQRMIQQNSSFHKQRTPIKTNHLNLQAHKCTCIRYIHVATFKSRVVNCFQKNRLLTKFFLLYACKANIRQFLVSYPPPTSNFCCRICIYYGFHNLKYRQFSINSLVGLLLYDMRFRKKIKIL